MDQLYDSLNRLAASQVGAPFNWRRMRARTMLVGSGDIDNEILIEQAKNFDAQLVAEQQNNLFLSYSPTTNPFLLEYAFHRLNEGRK